MGLKILTLALHSINGKRVEVHGTKKKARVTSVNKDGEIHFSLLFDDGSIQGVTWSQDDRGYIANGLDLDEPEEDPSLV